MDTKGIIQVASFVVILVAVLLLLNYQSCNNAGSTHEIRERVIHDTSYITVEIPRREIRDVPTKAFEQRTYLVADKDNEAPATAPIAFTARTATRLGSDSLQAEYCYPENLWAFALLERRDSIMLIRDSIIRETVVMLNPIELRAYFRAEQRNDGRSIASGVLAGTTTIRGFAGLSVEPSGALYYHLGAEVTLSLIRLK